MIGHVAGVPVEEFLLLVLASGASAGPLLARAWVCFARAVQASLLFSTRAFCSSLRASRLALRCASSAAAISSSTSTTDPEHWEDDWREELGNVDDVGGAVDALLTAARRDG
jgi:hypothetical protein